MCDDSARIIECKKNNLKKIKYCNLNLEDEEFEDTKGDIMLCKCCI